MLHFTHIGFETVALSSHICTCYFVSAHNRAWNCARVKMSHACVYFLFFLFVLVFNVLGGRCAFSTAACDL